MKTKKNIEEGKEGKIIINKKQLKPAMIRTIIKIIILLDSSYVKKRKPIKRKSKYEVQSPILHKYFYYN